MCQCVFYASLGSKKQCQAEEDLILEEEAMQIDECQDSGMGNDESGDKERPEGEGNEDKDTETTDKNIGNPENQNTKRKRKLLKK